MRRCWAIVRATALEATSEPLALLLTLGAAALVLLATVFSFHQFGEPTRFARDAGLSALLVFGAAYAFFCTIKVFRREIESGTAQMALSHPVSRTGFFVSKIVGVAAAYLLFFLTVGGVAEIAIVGMEVGRMVAAVRSDLAMLWTPALLTASGVAVGSLVLAAALNAFAHARFTTTATLLLAFLTPIAAYALAQAGGSYCASLSKGNLIYLMASGFDSAFRFLPAAVAVALPAPVFIAAAAAFSVRFRDNVASAVCVALFIVALPALGNYYMSESLANGGTVSWGRVALVGAATLPFLAAFALLGLHLFKDRDVG